MTNEDLDVYIQQLNAAPFSDNIFTRNLSSKVIWAKVWKKVPTIDDKPDPYSYPYKMFFIKNEKEIYVGVVLDMGSRDLHWYIQKDHRKRGYMTRALRETILPFIFYEERDTQRLTIDPGQDEYEDSKKVAIKAGFTAVNEKETEFELSNEDFEGNKYLVGEKEEIS